MNVQILMATINLVNEKALLLEGTLITSTVQTPVKENFQQVANALAKTLQVAIDTQTIEGKFNCLQDAINTLSLQESQDGYLAIAISHATCGKDLGALIDDFQLQDIVSSNHNFQHINDDAFFTAKETYLSTRVRLKDYIINGTVQDTPIREQPDLAQDKDNKTFVLNLWENPSFMGMYDQVFSALKSECIEAHYQLLDRIGVPHNSCILFL